MAAIPWQDWYDRFGAMYEGDENESAQQQAQNAYDSYYGSVIQQQPLEQQRAYYQGLGINDGVVQSSSPMQQQGISNLDQWIQARNAGNNTEFGLAKESFMTKALPYAIAAAGTAGMLGLLPGTTSVLGAGAGAAAPSAVSAGAGASAGGLTEAQIAAITAAEGGYSALPAAGMVGTAAGAGAGAAAAASPLSRILNGAKTLGTGLSTAQMLGLGLGGVGAVYGAFNQPDLPQAPDYMGLARLQGDINQQTSLQNTMLGNPNFSNPWGSQSVSYERDPTTGNYIPRVAQQLNPAAQALFDQQMRTNQGMGNLSEQSLGRVGAAMGSEFNPSLPGMTGGVSDQYGVRTGIPGAGDIQRNIGGTNGSVQYGIGNAGGIADGFADVGSAQRSIAPAGQVTRDIANVGDVSRNIGPTRGVQSGLDFSGAPSLPGADDATRQRVEDALYGRATSRLDPEWQQRERQLETKLLNAGIERGTEAWNRELDQFSRQRTDAYDTARNAAISSGGSEQSRLFGMGLQSRQQAVGETTAQGQFSNSSQAQDFNQQYQRLLSTNQAQAQAFLQAAQRGEFGNAAQQQAFTQNLAGGQFANAGQAQDYAQAAGRATFGNTAQAQRYGQMLGMGQFNNQAQAQDFNQQAQRFTSANQAQQQQFNQNTAATQQYNSASDQAFRNQLAGGNFGNQARNQSVQEALMRRQLPLNEFNAFRSGSQVQMPNFQGYNSSQSQAAPVFNAGQQQYGANLDAYNANVGQRNSTMNGLFGLGSSVLMGR